MVFDGCNSQGYSSSAQTQNALDGLRWVADYFVKCHHSDVAYTGQVRHDMRPLSPLLSGINLERHQKANLLRSSGCCCL